MLAYFFFLSCLLLDILDLTIYDPILPRLDLTKTAQKLWKLKRYFTFYEEVTPFPNQLKYKGSPCVLGTFSIVTIVEV